jgi:hypothetical protein
MAFQCIPKAKFGANIRFMLNFILFKNCQKMLKIFLDFCHFWFIRRIPESKSNPKSASILFKFGYRRKISSLLIS